LQELSKLTPKESLDRNSIIKTLKYKMNILDKIIVDKRREVILKKSIIPVSQLEASVFFSKRLYPK
jgi:hypothetical protein